MSSEEETTLREPDFRRTDRQTGEVYRWGGHNTCFCTQCRQFFIGVSSFDRHFRATTTTDGNTSCLDPRTEMRGDGEPAFERVEKPSWNPAYAWRKTSATRGDKPPPWRQQP